MISPQAKRAQRKTRASNPTSHHTTRAACTARVHSHQGDNNVSHFPVLVAVPEDKTLDEVLLPYTEFECSGLDGAHIQEIDKTDEVKADAERLGSMTKALDYYGLLDRCVTDETQIDRSGTHKYSYALVRYPQPVRLIDVSDGSEEPERPIELIKAVRRTNPNAKWDWWTVGGRWSEYAARDAGTPAELGLLDLTQRKFDRALQTRHLFWAARYDAAREPLPEAALTRAQETLTGHWADVEQAHAIYFKPQDLALDTLAFKALEKINRWFMWSLSDAVDMHRLESDFIARHEWEAPFHAYLSLDGIWHEVGEMGWWAMCSEENADTYNGEYGEFWTWFNGLPDDTQLYVVDCHI
jgi:hypothetical protein